MSAERLELFDSHAHLDFGKLADERAGILERAWAAGLRDILAVGSGRGVEGALDAVQLAAGDSRIWASVGVHPHDADLGVKWQGDPQGPLEPDVLAEWEDAARVALYRQGSLAIHPRVVAIGEVGLDFHYDHSPREIQRQLFRRYIRLAHDLSLPLIIHAREDGGEVAAILSEEDAGAVGGVIHCFSGDPDLARVALDLGFSFGLTGVLTFKNATALRQIVADIPLERLLVETDSPYLAPVPYRGKRNEPAYVAEVVRQLAQIKKLEVQEVARQTSRNARRLFGIERLLAQEAGAIVYRLGRSIYLNITNRCTLACRFCLKHSGMDLGGYELGLLHEPDAEQVLSAVRAELSREQADEVVFCGIGEPLLRPDLVAQVGRALMSRGIQVRVNTDGLANLVHGRNVLTDLQGAVHSFSVSLNGPDGDTHSRLCPSAYGRDAFPAVCDFIRQAVELFDHVQASAVRASGLDMDRTEDVARSLGASFRIRG